MAIRNIRKLFSKNLRRIRERKGYTQEDLAEALNINTRYIQRLEGKDCPSVRIDTVQALAKVLSARFYEFFEE